MPKKTKEPKMLKLTYRELAMARTLNQLYLYGKVGHSVPRDYVVTIEFFLQRYPELKRLIPGEL